MCETGDIPLLQKVLDAALASRCPLDALECSNALVHAAVHRQTDVVRKLLTATVDKHAGLYQTLSLNSCRGVYALEISMFTADADNDTDAET